MKIGNIALLASAFVVGGCATIQPNADRGPQGTIAYTVAVESSEPGVRIEANEEYVGATPLTFKIYGDADGTFHNFGRYEYVIRPLPLKPGQRIQTKVFRTGGWFTPEDSIPKRIFFDMNQGAVEASTTNAPAK